MSEKNSPFKQGLKKILPRLKVYAMSLTRDRDAADDLVHDTMIRAMRSEHQFSPGTNLSAWLFRIQRNEFISGLRRLRPSVPVDSAIAETLSHQPHQESQIVLREFIAAFQQLAPTQRKALLLSVIEGLEYERIGAIAGVSVGTVKSRISRARDKLARLLGHDSVSERTLKKITLAAGGLKAKKRKQTKVNRAAEVDPSPHSEVRRPQTQHVWEPRQQVHVVSELFPQVEEVKEIEPEVVLPEPIIAIAKPERSVRFLFFGLEFGPPEQVRVGNAVVHVYRIAQ